MDRKRGLFPFFYGRITPATKEQDIVNFAEVYGVHDPALVVHEEFFQWVIADKFFSQKPKFELAGIQMVSNVDPHEKMKLRSLNGTHSALAYLGYLAGSVSYTHLTLTTN